MTEREQPQDEYWNHDEAIGEVSLWRNERYSLRLKAHIAEEIYRQGKGEEIIPLRQQRGVRTYVQAKPYVLIPNITLGIRLSPTPDPSGAIGEVASSIWEGMRHEEIGQAQAWFYVEDRTIVLWEAYLLPRYRAPDLREDANTYALWEGFERFLTGHFPSARQIVTTHDDPEYDTTQYQELLGNLGYSRLNPRAFGKELGRAGRPMPDLPHTAPHHRADASPPARFELWDTDSGNLIGAYRTESEAIALVRRTLAAHGPDAIAAWALGSRGLGERDTPVLEGPTLLDRALRGDAPNDAASSGRP